MSILNLSQQQEEPQVEALDQILKEREARKRKLTLIACIVLLIIVWLLAMLLWYLWKSRPEPVPPAVEQTQDVAVKEETPDPPPEQVEEKKPDVTVTLASDTVEIFTAPAQRPEGHVMYQLIAGGVVLAQSDRLEEGQNLETMSAVSNIDELIVPGEHDAKFRCIFYGEDGGMEISEGEEILLSVLE